MIITSVNNDKIKDICKLNEKKYRDSTNTFLIEGEHLVREAMRSNLFKELILLEGVNIPFDGPILYVNDKVMKKISCMDSYPKVMGICYKKKEENIGNRVLILEDIQDPGNLGTIIRSSVAFDVDTIILSKKCADLYGTKVDGGVDIRDIDIPGRYALIIGNEGRGMSDNISKLCDEYLYIKMNEMVESLNAGVATSILLYEMYNK